MDSGTYQPIIPNCMLLISVGQVIIDRLAHGAEGVAAIRRECGEVLGHGGSCHVGDDTRLRKADERIKIQETSCTAPLRSAFFATGWMLAPLTLNELECFKHSSLI